MSDVIAAIDCGSNSTRLFIADQHGARRREMRITRLSEGVDSSMMLREAAVQRSCDVLNEYRRYMDEAFVTRGLLVATSAVRDARNGQDFLKRAQRIVGVDARILDGNEEAQLSYDGATHELTSDPRPTAIVDVGGGSTEIALEIGGQLHSFSMQLGCVRVTERALGKEIVEPDRDEAARRMINDELDRAFQAVPLLATSSATCVSWVSPAASRRSPNSILVLKPTTGPKSDHRTMSRDIVEKWRSTLASESPEARLARAGMVVGREDVLTAGLYVLEAVMDRFEVTEILSSESDILDGIVYSLLS